MIGTLLLKKTKILVNKGLSTRKKLKLPNSPDLEKLNGFRFQITYFFPLLKREMIYICRLIFLERIWQLV